MSQSSGGTPILPGSRPFPQGADGNGIEPLSKADGDLAVIQHQAGGESLSGGLFELAQPAEVGTGHGGRRLHFDACHFQRDKRPGRWRDEPIAVTAGDGTLAYRAPDAEQVPALMAEVVRWLREDDADQNVVVRAAMAHLHVVSAHPFRDGNGRVARIVQSLVLAREGLISSEFSSIEEHLGQNTSAYYAALKQAQGGSYQPDRDASGWVTFCVEAHLAQARQRLAQIKAAAMRWDHLESLVIERGWPERLMIALEQSLIGGAERGSYGKEADISRATASADFRRLLDAGLVDQRGRGKNTSYRASRELQARVAQALEGDA